jgi:hypothetical protein
MEEHLSAVRTLCGFADDRIADINQLHDRFEERIEDLHASHRWAALRHTPNLSQRLCLVTVDICCFEASPFEACIQSEWQTSAALTLMSQGPRSEAGTVAQRAGTVGWAGAGAVCGGHSAAAPAAASSTARPLCWQQ